MKNQDLIFYALIIIALWLMFFRKADGFCGGCGALAA
jgi:hypothetical protein